MLAFGRAFEGRHLISQLPSGLVDEDVFEGCVVRGQARQGAPGLLQMAEQ
jgi:hypothetical protein